MQFANINTWLLLSISFGLMLLVACIMIRQAQKFYTLDVIIRKFSIMELEMAATPKEMVNVIKGLYDLPPEQARTSLTALKNQLRLDFLYMPLLYGSIFFITWRVANKMEIQAGFIVFATLAFLQGVAWICNIIEDIYLLGKIKNDVHESTFKRHKMHLVIEAIKWGIALTATVCSFSAIAYFWLTGKYSIQSFEYLIIVLGELIIFGIIVQFLIKRKPKPVLK